MAVDNNEYRTLVKDMIKAENTGNWDDVANELNDRKNSNFNSRPQDLADTVNAAAKYCQDHGFPMTVITNDKGDDVVRIKDNTNSSIRPVGITETPGGYVAHDKI